MKKIISSMLILCTSLSLLAGCGKRETPSETEVPPAAEDTSGRETEVEINVETESGEIPTLVVANWKGYGADEEFGAPRFEELYNCKVEFVYFNSVEELYTMLQTGGIGNIDVALPSTVYTQTFRESGMLEPVDTSKVPCYGDLMEAYLNLPEATGEGGEVYALPWTWGTTSLGYNPEAVTEEVTTWDILYGDAHKGKIAFFDDYVTALMTSAIHTGQNPSDPDNLDLQVIKEDLLALKENVCTYWASYDDYLNPYTSGEVVIGNMWAGTATQLKNSGTPCNYIYPVEGTVGYVDMWCIIKDTDCYDLACKWLDFMCGEEFQYNFATVEGNAHNTVNNKVYEKLTDEQKAALWALEIPSKVYMQPVLTPEQQNDWLEVWNEVKAN